MFGSTSFHILASRYSRFKTTLYEKMNITQVYLTPDYDTSKNEERVKYQNETTYIQLFVEECLRKNKVELGKFNRLVFSEGGDSSKDFNVVGNNALPVAISDTRSEIDSLESERDFHNYYIRKLMEGFTKIDAHFKSTFVSYLEPLLAANYKSDLSYEKQMATKRIDRRRVQVIGRYDRKSFKLLVNIYAKKELLKSEAIFECVPDMFIVKYDAYKVEINDQSIVVINRNREKTLEREIAAII